MTIRRPTTAGFFVMLNGEKHLLSIATSENLSSKCFEIKY